jgi:hypothetical protein
MQRALIVLQRVLAALFAAGLVCLVVTGLLTAQPSIHALHRWSAHAMVIFAWVMLPLAIGLRYAIGSGSIKFVALLAVLFLGLLFTSVTGYLGPSTAAEYGEQLGEETKNRFVVLHMGVLPAVLCLLSGIWVWAAFARGTSVTTVS